MPRCRSTASLRAARRERARARGRSNRHDRVPAESGRASSGLVRWSDRWARHGRGGIGGRSRLTASHGAGSASGAMGRPPESARSRLAGRKRAGSAASTPERARRGQAGSPARAGSSAGGEPRRAGPHGSCKEEREEGAGRGERRQCVHTTCAGLSPAASSPAAAAGREGIGEPPGTGGPTARAVPSAGQSGRCRGSRDIGRPTAGAASTPAGRWGKCLGAGARVTPADRQPELYPSCRQARGMSRGPDHGQAHDLQAGAAS